MLAWLKRLVATALRAASGNSRLGGTRLAFNYLRIECKAKFLRGWLGRKITVEEIWGQQIHFYDYLQFAVLFEELYVGGFYEFSSAKPNPRIIDCGANIGLAIAYVKTLYPQARVTAFEAEPRTFEMLKRNSQENGWNAELHSCAVYNHRGKIQFHTNSPGSLVASVCPTGLASYNRVDEVDCVPLSEYITEEVDLLIMDVEGAEHEVLGELQAAGKLPLIRRMILEYHHHVGPDNDRLGGFLSALEQAGFGYHLRAPLPLPFPSRELQCFLIGAYRKDAAQ